MNNTKLNKAITIFFLLVKIGIILWLVTILLGPKADPQYPLSLTAYVRPSLLGIHSDAKGVMVVIVDKPSWSIWNQQWEYTIRFGPNIVKVLENEIYPGLKGGG